MNPYIADVLDQPQALARTLDHLRHTASELNPLAARLRQGAFRRIVLTGMGSSLAALYPLWYRLVQAGYAPLLVETSELLYDASALIVDHTLLVVVSQSGGSVEIVRLVEQHRSATILAITNTAESALVRGASALVLIAAGDEHSVSCKTYISTLAALSICGDVLLDQLADVSWQALTNGIDQMSAYLRNWNTYATDLAEMFSGDSLVICGRGPSLAAVHYGALILKEAAKVHAEGLGSAQFRHGPLELAATGLRVLVYQGLSNAAILNQRLVRDIRHGGGRAMLVGFDGELAALCLPVVSPATLPLLEALPTQLLSIGFAWQRAIEPGQFVIGAKVTIEE